ncbi:MAG: lamin tail domain-containing protein [Planctomycetes bacterium]|nr:lamin tail domain-containing protein [Planctomycetota bacterium]
MKLRHRATRSRCRRPKSSTAKLRRRIAPPEALEKRLVLDSTVVFNEIMYNPLDDPNNGLEWIELHNQLAVDMDISEWHLEGGVDYTFADGTIVPGKGYLVVAADPEALAARTGFAEAIGPFIGRLSNGGEELRLFNNDGRRMNVVDYGDHGAWPVAPDGGGASLAKASILTNSEDAENWTFSDQIGGTPGEANFVEGDGPKITTFLSRGAEVSVLVPADDSLGTTWTETAFVEGNDWIEGETSVGFGIDDQPSVGLVGYWNFDDNVTDQSNNGNNGTLRGGASYSSDVPGTLGGGKSIRFDGAGDVVQVNDVTILDGRDAATFSAWIKPQSYSTAADGRNMIVSKDNAFEFGFRNQQMVLRISNGTHTETTPPPTPAISTGVWHHVAAVYADARVTYYLDGELFDEIPLGDNTGDPFSINDTNTTLFFGNRERNDNKPFDGFLDELAIYDYALAPSQVAALSEGADPAGLDGPTTDIGGVMQGQNASAYLRVPFVANGVAALDSLTLSMAYNDGFVAYLNGELVVSANAPGFDGNPGTLVWNSSATASRGEAESLDFASFSINSSIGHLRDGLNILAIHGLNSSAGDGTFLITPQLVGIEALATKVKLNEIAGADDAEFFVELANDGGSPVDVGGYVLSATGRGGGEYVLPPQTIGGGGLLVVNGDDLGFRPADGERLFLYSAGRGRVLDARVTTNSLRGRSEEHDGRWLWPDVPTPDAPNSFAFHDEIVINEIMYHAPPQLRSDTQPYLSSDEEWIELYNRSDEAVDLGGWQLRDAVEFEFDADTMLGPGEYLVVAWDAVAMAAKFPGIDIAGTFSGRLSNQDERILLRDANKNPADEVHYYERGKWAEFADGGGSSLELRDPDSDNSQGAAWAASDESDASQWIDYSYSAGASETICCGNDFRELVFGLLDSGEFLIDNVVVRRGNGSNMISNGTFQGDAIGSSPSSWRFNGNHSGTIVADPENAANRVLHVVVSGPQQHVNDNIDINLNQSVFNSTHTISFRIKWITGSAQLNSRLFYTRMSNTAIMEVPTRLGTPGAQNSAFESNIGPTYSEFSHFPLLPASNEPVTVSARPSDPDGVTSMRLWWSNNGGNWSSVTMTDAGGGLFIGTIPGQSNNTRIQFYVEGEDSLGARSTFPARGRDSRAMYQVRPETARQIDTFRLVMRSSDENLMAGGNRYQQMSNRYVGTTLIVNGERAFYDVEIRLIGSGFIRPNSGYKVKLDPEQRFYGVHDSLRFDVNGTREIVYKQMVNRAGGSSVSMYDDVSYLASGSLPVTNRNMLLNLARYEDIYLDEQFVRGSDGTKFELDDITRPSGGTPHTNRSMAAMDVRNAGSNPEPYRGQLLIKNNRAEDDLASMAAFSQAIHQSGSFVGSALDVATQEVLDVDLWMRHYATQAFIGNWDSYGFNRPKNIRIYVRPEDGKIIPLYWDADLANLSSQALIYNGGATRLDDIRNIPSNTRLFWGHMLDLIDRAFNVQYASAWNARFGALGASGINIGSLSTQVGRAESQARSAVREIDFTITTNNGNPFSTGNASTTIRGDGWIDVREIRLAGSEDPLDVRWTDNNSWQINMPLAEGANELNFEAYNFRGELIATDSITVTSTDNDERVADVLRISEVMYNPYDPPEGSPLGNGQFEFIELVNTGNQSVDLRGVEFTNGISFAFTGSNVTTLGAGEHVVVVRNFDAFGERYETAGMRIAGVYEGALNDGGERVTLEDSFGTTIVSFRYDNDGVWPGRPDGGGSSLEIVDSEGDYEDGRNWRASTQYGGSPGVAGVGPIPGVVINEVLTHTDPPLTDAIELFNPTGQSINIGGWFLSDTNNNYQKFRIPDLTQLGPGEYISYNETHFNASGLDLDPANDDPNDFALNGAHGDDVWLLAADPNTGQLTRFVDRVEFEAGVSGESFGRWPNGSGTMFPLTERTFGGPNSGPRFGPVIFSEIMFHPVLPAPESGLDANDLELIEGALKAFDDCHDAPTIIILRSTIAFGSPNKAGTSAAHGAPLGEEEVKLTKTEYGWPVDEHFLVPAEVPEHFAAGIGRRGCQQHESWQEQFAQYEKELPQQAAELQAIWQRRLPEGWDADLTEFQPDEKGMASRVSSGKVLNAIAPNLPWLLGGSADLAPSNMTRLTFDGAGDFGADNYAGRNFHFGVREHGMASICNGMSLSGLRPYCGTFFIFTDYMRPSMRLAAMGAAVV